MSCVILPHTRSLFKTCSSSIIACNNFRFYSGENKFGKSNDNFPSFSTKEKFQDFEKTPNLRSIASIILKGTTTPNDAKLFAMPTASLIEGSLYAVESVTQAISSDTDLSVSDLTSQLSIGCLDQFKAVLASNDKLSSEEGRFQIGIDKEDIILAWLGKYDEQKNRMKICTFSYPSYHFIRQRVEKNAEDYRQFMTEQTEAVKEGRITKDELRENVKAKLLNEEHNKQTNIKEHMEKNDIIVCNWDFVKDDNDWKIDEMAMRKLSEVVPPPFHWLWHSYRLKMSIAKNTDFVKVLQTDFFSTYLIYLILLQYVLFIIMKSAM